MHRSIAALVTLAGLLLPATRATAESPESLVTRISRGVPEELRRHSISGVALKADAPNADDYRIPIESMLAKSGIKVDPRTANGEVEFVVRPGVGGANSVELRIRDASGKIVYRTLTSARFGPPKTFSNPAFPPNDRMWPGYDPRSRPLRMNPSAEPGNPDVEPQPPSPADGGGSKPLLLRSSAFRAKDVGGRYVALPAPRPGGDVQAGSGLTVVPFEEPAPSAETESKSVRVTRGGELVAIWIATRMDEAGFDVVVKVDEDDEQLAAAVPHADRNPSASKFPLVVTGTARLELESGRPPSGPPIAWFATMECTVDVRRRGDEEPLYSRTWRPDSVTRSGSLAEQAKLREQAVATLLDAFTRDLLADADFTRLPRTKPETVSGDVVP